MFIRDFWDEKEEWELSNAEGKSSMFQTDASMTLISKKQLEHTIHNLTEEIERLSISNQQLIEDLKTRNFFDKYNDSMLKLNKLRNHQQMLIDNKFESFQVTKARPVPSLSMSNITRTFGDNSEDNIRYKHNSACVNERKTAKSVKSSVMIPKIQKVI